MTLYLATAHEGCHVIPVGVFSTLDLAQAACVSDAERLKADIGWEQADETNWRSVARFSVRQLWWIRALALDVETGGASR